jgi:glycosyltransferase involved in cell wall biosynthesis
MKKINRLIIADPSFEDWVGHHAPYDISILKAGDQAGMKVQIWAAKVIDADISAYADGISKIYSCSAWGQPYQLHTPLKSRVVTLYRSLFLFRPAPEVYDKLNFRAAKAFRQALRPIKYFVRNLVPPIVRRILLHPASSLVDFIPPVVLELRKSLLKKIEHTAGRRRNLLPALLVVIYKQLTPSFFKRLISNPVAWTKDLLPPIVTKLAQAALSKISKSSPRAAYFPLLGRSKTEYLETIRAVAKNKLKGDDILFSHMITGYNFLAWAVIAKYCEKKGIKTKILFRYPTSFIPEHRADIKMGRLLYEQCSKSGFVDYYSDSHILAEQYRDFLNAPVQTLPIPHLPTFDGSYKNELDRKINVVVLGNARAEKGFCEIIRSIKLLQDSGEQGLEFVIQTNNPDCDAAARMHELDEITDIKITKCGAALTEKEYAKVLSNSDVVLAPYHSEVYGARTSGVLLEAISASKIAIVVEHTWLATELQENGAGVIVKNKSATSIARALVHVRDNFSQLRAEALTKAKAYREKHGAENFLNCLIGKNKLLAPARLRALIVFPFSDFFEQSTGATVRSGLLCQYLLSEGVEVSVVLPLQSTNVIHPRLIGATFYKYGENPIQASGLKSMLMHPLSRKENYRSVWYTTRSDSNSDNIELDRALNRALRPDTVVLVDYPFDIENVRRVTRVYGNRISITLHDLMGLFGEKGALRSKALSIELAAAGSCDRVVTVAQHESDFLSSIGVENELIPNPCVITRQCTNEPFSETMGFRIDGRFALFVGSNHLPNNDAAIALKAVAKQLSDGGSRVKIVVAGSCLEAGLDEGFVSLGKVSDEGLRYLNENCSMFVCPLAGGTGASLKTIQAMGFNKIVLGTRDAFRGLNVTNLVNCIVEDNLDEYPRWIMEIDRDSGRFGSIGSRARDFAEEYDYRSVFKSQLEYIKRSAGVGAGLA